MRIPSSPSLFSPSLSFSPSRLYEVNVISRRRFSAVSSSIDPSKLSIERTLTPKPQIPRDQLVFGRTFTDHKLEIVWNKTSGWLPPRILPYGPLTLDPACNVFHYAIECFEGMKAYIDSKDRIRLFRPDMNMRRLNSSANALALPTFEGQDYMKCLKELLKVDKKWIPKEKGYSLYIRPTLIGTQPSVGVGASGSALFFTILSPVGPYYPEGFKPVKLYVDEKNARAWPGGAGAHKIGGNYAPTIRPQLKAAEKGYSQILWLTGEQVTEVGTMNMFTLWKNEKGEEELITAPLDGTILPGVTRDSILSLCKKWNKFKVSEAPYTIHQLVDALKQNRVIEIFGAGTAAIVSPVCQISYKGTEYSVPINPEAGAGKLTKMLMDEIMAIQYGEKENEWSVVVD